MAGALSDFVYDPSSDLIVRTTSLGQALSDIAARAPGDAAVSLKYWRTNVMVLGSYVADWQAIDASTGASACRRQRRRSMRCWPRRGVGAVLGGIAMPGLRAHLSRDSQVMLGGIVCGAVLIPVALMPSAVVTNCAMMVFGCGWIIAASNLQAAVQLASAPWVRARGVAIYQAIFNGGMGFGAIVWGGLAESAGLAGTILAAGLGGIGIALVARAYPLQQHIIDPSLRPQSALPSVVPHNTMSDLLISNRHPVVVTIAYKVDETEIDEFRAAMLEVAAARRRDGAITWVLGRDIERPEFWLESFRLPDWHELQRGLARVNLVDATATAAARAFHRGKQPPEISVWIIDQG